MPIGRQKSSSSKVEIKAPPAIQQIDFNLPTGDRYISSNQGRVETFESQLSPLTQATVSESMSALQNLAQEINQPDSVRQAAIDQRSQDFFNSQARGINEDADLRLSQTQSDLSKRFGGAYNSSFGADMLARVENNRLLRLSDARQQASLLGEDLTQNDQDNRIKRFALFQNYLGDLNNQAQGIQSAGANILQSEQQRATEIASQRANLISRMQMQDNEIAAQSRQQAAAMAAAMARSFQNHPIIF